jgi:hypothetical protein
MPCGTSFRLLFGSCCVFILPQVQSYGYQATPTLSGPKHIRLSYQDHMMQWALHSSGEVSAMREQAIYIESVERIYVMTGQHAS